MRISIDEPEIQKVEKTEESIEREAVKKTFKGEMKKLSNMSFSEKLKYIWSYYWIPIVAGIVAVVLVCYVISFMSSRKEVMLMGVVVNDTQTKVQEISQDIGAYLGLSSKQQVDLVDGVFTSSTSYGTQYSHNMSGSTQLLTYVMARELDFVLCDQEGLEFLQKNELCRDVREYINDDQKDKLSERMFIPEGGSKCEAIDLTGTTLVEELGLHQEKTYLVLVIHRSLLPSFNT